MSSVPLLARIESMLAGLSPAEQRVGRVLLADPAGFAQRPVALLAEQAQTSKPTVVRFSRSVGYEGLVDLKHALAGIANQDGVPFVHRAVHERDSTPALLTKVIDNAARALLDYRDQVAAHSIERAISALAATVEAGARVGFYGMGNSGVVAQDAHFKFLRLGVHSEAVSDAHLQVISATWMGPRDCAVIISNSGRSAELIKLARLLHRRGATVILITASGSPLACSLPAQRHVFLPVDHAESPALYSPMVSRLLHLVLIDILATGVALRLPKARRQVLEDVKRELQRRR